MNPNAKERRHMRDIHEHPCIACGRYGVEGHHVMQDFPGKVRRRDHRYIIPVCPDCHRGRRGIHGIGCEVKWAEGLQIDVPARAIAYWEAAK